MIIPNNQSEILIAARKLLDDSVTLNAMSRIGSIYGNGRSGKLIVKKTKHFLDLTD